MFPSPPASYLHTPRAQQQQSRDDFPSPLSYATFPPSFPPGSPSSFSEATNGPGRGGGGGGGGGGGSAWGGSPERGGGRSGSVSPLSGHLGSNTSVGELVDKALNRSAAVQVVLRVRPMNSLELRQEDPEPCLRVVNDHRMQYRHLEVVVNRGAREETVTAYTFDRVVPEEVGQRELFEMSGVQELMDAALHGINVSVFAYGQTGSGKTYTMSGLEEHLMRGYREDDQTMGIISRSVSYLFARIGEDAEGSRTAVKASFSEIYNERVYDLLNLTGEQLPLGYHAETKTVFMQGQVLVDCESVEDVMAVVSEGHRNRTVGSHALNADSSRSHSILQISLERATVDKETGETVRSRSKIMFVDLAGSERLKASQSTGATAVESRYINKSLSTLARVIHALSDPKAAKSHKGGGAAPHAKFGPGDIIIPYRESMLTRLLQDSLGGSALTVMIACVSPAPAYLQETLMTLNYAARASRIENAPIIHVDSKDAILMSLKRDLKHFKLENRAMRVKLSLPPEGPILELLSSLPVLVPVDTVLVKQKEVAPVADALVQTEPLHPSHLAPRPTARRPAAAEDVGGKGSLMGRHRGRLGGGTTSTTMATRMVGGEDYSSGGGGGGASSSSSSSSPSLRMTKGGILIVSEEGGGEGGGGDIFGNNPKNLPTLRLAERLAERSSRQVVLDMQQGEIAMLMEEKDTLKQKVSQQTARMTVLTSSLEEAKGVIRKLEATLGEARRGKVEAENNVSRVLTGASAAGWPLPIPLDPPLGSAAPGVVPFHQAAKGGSSSSASSASASQHYFLNPHLSQGGSPHFYSQQATSEEIASQLVQLGGGGDAEAQLKLLMQAQVQAQQSQRMLQQQQAQLIQQQQALEGGGGGRIFAGSGARGAFGLSPQR